MSQTASETATAINCSNSANNKNNNVSHAEPPIKQIKFYLDKYKIKDALQIFFNNSTLRLLGEEPDFMWDVIPLICTRLRGLCQYRFRVFEGCERMLCRIAVDEHCNPKEVLISLLAEINQTEHQEDDNVFRAMIRPLEGALLRMNLPSPREENFRWTLDVLMRHINDTPLPDEFNLEGKQRVSLPNDPNVKRFIETLPLILSFIEELNDRPIDYDRSPMPILTESQIDEVLNGELVDDDDFISDENAPPRCDITDASTTTLLRLIHRPLTFLDTTHYCKELRAVGVKCLSLLLKMVPNLFAPIYKHSSIIHGSRKIDDLIAAGDMDSDGPIDILSSNHFDESIGQAAEMISSSISSMAVNHAEGNYLNAMLTLATCAYLFRCEAKPSATTSPNSSSTPPQIRGNTTSTAPTGAAVPNLVAPTAFPLMDMGQPFTMHAMVSNMTQHFPQILSHESLLFSHVPFIVILLKRHEVLAQEKGLILLANLFDLLTPKSQGRRMLYLLKASSLMEQLFQIMILSPLCTNRRLAHELFTHLCDLLTFGCKLDLFDWIIKQTELSPCIRATCIDQYRKTLTAIGSGGNEATAAMEFCQVSTRIDEFIISCIDACLPDGKHTDIIENNDLILATLAMFRYLKLRNDIVHLSPKALKKSLFDPIRSAVAMLKSEVKAHMEELSEVECLNFALCRLDLVESVLVRTCDLYGC